MESSSLSLSSSYTRNGKCLASANKCFFIVTPIFISFIVDMTNDDDDLRHTAT